MANCVFATAMTRSNEKKLLTKEQLRVMIDSGNIDDICRTIQDAGYGSDSEQFRPETYQKILSNREINMFEETLQISKDFQVLKALNLINDYHNIKVLLKAEGLGVDRSDILLNTGNIPADKMVEYVRDRSKMLSEEMHNAVLEASETLARTKDPQQVDFICDKYYFIEMNRIAEENKNDFVKGYVELKIDIANLKTYARVKSMKQPWSYYSEVFIPGGNIDFATYQKAYNEDVAQFGSHFKGTLLAEAATTGREDLEKTNDYTLFEKLCDDAAMDYAKSGKEISFGIEVVFAYYIAKQIEMMNIRILMAGKLANMDSAKIQERMRKTYE